MFRSITAILLLIFAGFAFAGSWYDPENPGHGLSVHDVEGEYFAEWYFHDGEQTRWIASDVCEYGESCPVWTVDASGFPADDADLIEAGSITLVPDGEFLLLDYALNIEGVDCSQLLVGPLPPECINPDGSRNWDYNDSFSASGAIELERLID